jgi:hypothetical protein
MTKLMKNTLADVTMRLLILLDVVINRLFNGRVETISARAGRGVESGKTWACFLCRLLDRIDPEHCEASVADPLGRLD